MPTDISTCCTAPPASSKAKSMLIRRRTISRLSVRPLLIVGMYAAALLTMMSAGGALVSAQTAGPTPVTKYFLPMGEAALLESMDKVNYRAAAPLNSMNSITIAADGTYVWYDHWVSRVSSSSSSSSSRNESKHTHV